VSKFFFAVNGLVGSLFKVCESYSEAHLYLKEHFVKEHPVPMNVVATDSLPSFPEGVHHPLQFPLEEKRSDLFKAIMLDLGGHSLIRDQSKGKEGKLFGYLF
jgi:hypothetical protein